MAIRDNHIAAEAMGVNTALYKSLIFGVSAAYTGVAGALSALAVAYVAPDTFNVFLSITFLIGIVIGGLASISGAVFGALFIQFVPELGPGHLQGRAVGDLRRLPDRLHVRRCRAASPASSAWLWIRLTAPAR